MKPRLLKSKLSSLLLLCVAATAGAQTRPSDSAWLPVWNNASGKLEGYLVLEPTEAPQVGSKLRFGNTTLDATFGLQAGDSLALLCNRRGNAGTLGSLPNNCLLAALGDGLAADRNASRGASATAAFSRAGTRLGVSTSTGRDTLPAWLTPGTRNRVDVNDLTVFAQKDVGNEGYVSIAGTLAKARLVPASQAPAFASEWSTRSLSIGGGIGSFGASIVGHVVDTPGDSPSFSGLGLGLTWRTPWSGQLTVGADNVVTRGKNPFSMGMSDDGEGTVPYVRYEQDL